MCDDPLEDETVTLVVEFADGNDARTAVESAIAERGGGVDRELRFADLEVTVPEAAVADLCDLDGIARVETTDTLSQTPSGAEE